jgi:NhaA family Na+:H+ antiporter
MAQGWAIASATDIAFALGMLALLGNRVPAALRVLLLAFAVLDDLGAVLVIALFHSKGVQLAGLAIAAVAIACTYGLLRWQAAQADARTAVREQARATRGVAALAHIVLAACLWAGLLYAGIHPTLAGVALGLLAPVAHRPHDHAHVPAATRLQARLGPWVMWCVMPLFAIANAGIPFPGAALSTQDLTLAGAIVAGLLFGKPLGIVGTVWLGTRIGLCRLPSDIGLRHLLVAGCLGGIGFTMSLFIAELAFQGSALLPAAKLGILAGSALSAVAGLALGVALLGRPQVTPSSRRSGTGSAP